MAHQTQLKPAFPENDASSLFSHFAGFSRNAQYHEVVREEVAFHAACRWPLLAEIQGICVTDLDKAK